MSKNHSSYLPDLISAPHKHLHLFSSRQHCCKLSACFLLHPNISIQKCNPPLTACWKLTSCCSYNGRLNCSVFFCPSSMLSLIPIHIKLKPAPSSAPHTLLLSTPFCLFSPSPSCLDLSCPLAPQPPPHCSYSNPLPRLIYGWLERLDSYGLEIRAQKGVLQQCHFGFLSVNKI